MEDLRKELISTMNKYIELLTSELDEVAPIAALHHWKSHRYNDGEDLRCKISEIKMEILQTPKIDTVKLYSEKEMICMLGDCWKEAQKSMEKNNGNPVMTTSFNTFINSHKK